MVDYILPTVIIVPQFAGKQVPFHRPDDASCGRDWNTSGASQSSSMGALVGSAPRPSTSRSSRGSWCLWQDLGLGPPGFSSAQGQSTHREIHSTCHMQWRCFVSTFLQLQNIHLLYQSWKILNHRKKKINIIIPVLERNHCCHAGPASFSPACVCVYAHLHAVRHQQGLPSPSCF